jgi:hypothetical protein
MYIFYHSLTVAVVNSWFLYRQYHEEQGTDKDVLPFRKFQAICTQSLTLAGNGKRRSCGLPSLEEILSAHRLQKKRGLLGYLKMYRKMSPTIFQCMTLCANDASFAQERMLHSHTSNA